MSSLTSGIVEKLTSQDVLEEFSETLPADAAPVSDAIAKIVPVLVEGFSTKSAKPGGGDVVYEVVQDADASLVDNLPDYVKENDSSKGISLLKKILPGKTNEIVDDVAGQSELSKAKVKRIVHLAMPVVASAIAAESSGQDLDAGGLAAMLAGEKSDIVAFESDEDPTKDAITPVAVVGSEEPSFSWVWWVIAALIALAAVALTVWGGDDSSESDETEQAVGEDDDSKDKDSDDAKDYDDRLGKVVKDLDGGSEQTEDATEENLAQRVESALEVADSLADSEISVTEVSVGSIELSGQVPNEATKDLALSLASDVSGADEVINSLEIAETESESQVAAPTKSQGESLNDILGLDPIRFGENSDVLLNSSVRPIGVVVEFLEASPEARLEVQGHTNNIGEARDNGERNARLSQLRAEAVVQALIAEGIESERLVAKGYGSSDPLVPHGEAGATEANRRVDLIVL